MYFVRIPDAMTASSSDLTDERECNFQIAITFRWLTCCRFLGKVGNTRLSLSKWQLALNRSHKMSEFCLNTNKYMFSFTIFILPIMYYVYPPNILLKYCLQFLLWRLWYPREIENNSSAIFWEFTRCMMCSVKMVNVKRTASGLTLKKRLKGFLKWTDTFRDLLYRQRYFRWDH